MCGINGFMSIGAAFPTNADTLIQSMNNCLSHRGPDDEGVFIDPNHGVALGHRRLSIIDLSPEGHQPMIDHAGNTIVFNGEIYNYKEIKNRLKGETFRTHSDTEVLMTLYSKFGHESLKQLNGMFAFAFHQKDKNQLMIARDRSGKKPFYFTLNNGFFSFSSEIKALLTLPWIKSEIDQDALYNFLTFNQLDAPQTMFKGIQKLEPGACMTVNKGGIIEHDQYWEAEYRNMSDMSEAQLSDTVFNELQKAVGYRMVADVPVGAFLSGGVDSSAVVALMRQFTEGPIKTYSVGFEGQPDYDERIYAQQVSKMFKTDHFEKTVGPEDIAEFLPKIIEIFDEPMADATCIPIYFISQLARKNGTVVVQTGDGADELFAGYRGWKKYQKIYPWYHRFTDLPPFLKNTFAAVAGGASDDSPINEIIQRGAKNQELFWGGAKAFKEYTKKRFLNPDWLKTVSDPDSYQVIQKHKIAFEKIKQKAPWLTDIDWMCYIGFKFLIPAKYLYRMDHLGMANSIEIRNPFLDVNLINTSLSVPSAYKVKNGEPKYILKKSLERILPDSILYRKKMGFCVPLREWSGEIMIDYVEKNMHEFCSNVGVFSEEGLKLHLREIRNGNTNLTNNLWTVYFLMAWFKRWM